MNLFEITLDQHMDMIEYAGNTLDKHDLIDSSAPSLLEVCTAKQRNQINLNHRLSQFHLLDL